MYYPSKRFRMKLKMRLKQYALCSAKTLTFLFWASLYVIVMKMTIFKDNVKNQVKEWPTVPDNYTKWLLEGPVLGEDDPISDNKLSWQEPDNETLAELDKRVETVQQVCRNRSLHTQTVNSKEFFVDYAHNIVWCNIFKAASTSWMYNFNILGGYDKKFLARTRQIPLMLARKKFPRPSADDVRDAVNTPGVVSMVIVREPFVRLLSAFRDKLEGTTPPYFRKLARQIVAKHREQAIKHVGKIKSVGPVFYEFVTHLIDQYKQDKKANKKYDVNEHWAPYYEFCSLCAVNFTIIAKVETLARDSGVVVNQLGLAHLLDHGVINRTTRLRTVKNVSRDGKKTMALMKFYFSQLNEKMLDDLLEIYGIDFEMFGYDPKIYYKYVKKIKKSI